MNKTVKGWLIAAALLIVTGTVIFAGVMAACNWDFTKIGTVAYVTETYEVQGEFDKISIDTATTDIEFVLTEDEYCSVVCFEAEKVRHSAAVQNGTLVITTADTRKWYEYICISFGTPKMTVYLPQSEYASLLIETDTGDITLPKEFSFESLKIHGDTSDVDCFANIYDTAEIDVDTGDINIDSITAGQLHLTTETGDINVKSASVREAIEIETDTGMTALADVSCNDLNAESDTGDITLKNVLAAGIFCINSDTGDVKFENSDASEITVKTSTGDVKGTLLSEKIFFAESETGRVTVPKISSGGKCEIETSTGDIDINVTD